MEGGSDLTGLVILTSSIVGFVSGADCEGAAREATIGKGNGRGFDVAVAGGGPAIGDFDLESFTV
jgi:hypothetical protein